MRLCLVVVALFVLSVTAVPLLSQKDDVKPASNNAELLARGKYLVEQVGMCQDCHTVMNEKGEHVREKWLQGAPVLFKPTVPIPAWSEYAVRIAGLPGWTDEQAIAFLMTGKNARGTSPRPPMPPYRFNREDAVAVTAYLRSLGSEAAGAEQASKK
ncbi:MAG TPA: c-type cytochrome [Terriglobales bacterium]|nr:c-type cytochrome [Terriglobales bacterium]